MGGDANYKSAFKTPGYTDFKAGNVVDVAHLKVSCTLFQIAMCCPYALCSLPHPLKYLTGDEGTL